MKNNLILILILLTYYSAYSHDIKMAVFEITEGGTGLEMSVTLDKEDFLETLSREFASHPTTANLESFSFEYLENKIAIQVNGECTSFTIKEIEHGELNIHIYGSLNISVGKVEEVQMTNTCMIDLFEDHNNIMKLKLNDRNRSFRLNRDRTSTIAIYD